jgi:hypothetical protein
MKQIKLFKQLETNFPDLSIGGSVLLNQFGLLSRNGNDLDINTHNQNHDFIQFCKIMSEIQPSFNKYNYGRKIDHNGNRYQHFQFILDGIKVCVFILEKKYWESITVGNITKINYIIHAKMFYAGKNGMSSKKHQLDIDEIMKNIDDKPFLFQQLKNNKIYENTPSTISQPFF